jgi:hypothetical protein
VRCDVFATFVFAAVEGLAAAAGAFVGAAALGAWAVADLAAGVFFAWVAPDAAPWAIRAAPLSKAPERKKERGFNVRVMVTSYEGMGTAHRCRLYFTGRAKA